MPSVTLETHQEEVSEWRFRRRKAQHPCVLVLLNDVTFCHLLRRTVLELTCQAGSQCPAGILRPLPWDSGAPPLLPNSLFLSLDYLLAIPPTPGRG